MQLSTLDLICAVMDTPRRPLTFAIILHLRDAPEAAALEAGAESAQRQFPSTAAVRSGREWRHMPDRPETIAFSNADAGFVEQLCRDFIDEPWDLTRQFPVRQLAITNPGQRGTILVTRFHHAAADGLSALMWLRHQVEVAFGLRSPTSTVMPYTHPVLRQHASARRTSPFAYSHPSDRLHHNGSPPSSARRWHTIRVESSAFKSIADADSGFTYNDQLATSALETFRLWNTRHAPWLPPEVGLWLPLNIRAKPAEGFGNGSSRVRVYSRYAPDATVHEKCGAVRRQVAWSREHGEWAVPEHRWLMRLPLPILRPVLRAYFNRPWVDMGTGVFTHMERSPLDALPAGMLSSVEIVGMLDVRHPLAIAAISVGDATHVTFVHDPAQLSDADALELSRLYQAQLAMALAEATA